MKFLPVCLLLAATVFPLSAAAQGLETVPPPPGTAQGELPQVILRIVNFVLGLVGVVALAFLVFGGFVYITSAGNEERIDQAKLIVTNAIIGVIVIGIAAAIVNFVIRAVGTPPPAGGL